MRKFALKFLLFSSPVAILVLIYIGKDPFKVIHHYNSFYRKNGMEYIGFNKDYVSTETFINNIDTYHYDSYILGSSRSMFYPVAVWSKYIGSEKCYHFDAFEETLFGMERKLSFLDSKKVNLKNVLLVMDSSLLAPTHNSKGYLFIKDPKISGESSIAFQYVFFKQFFDMHFLPAYLDVLFSKHLKKYMIDEKIFRPDSIGYDLASNELTFPDLDYQLSNDPEAYYTSISSWFDIHKKATAQYYTKPAIGKEQVILLKNIRAILQANHTNYKIVINPLYDQVKLAPHDQQILNELFGKEHVYDFSGINQFTVDYHNYYDNSHYRPCLATRILDSIYKH